MGEVNIIFAIIFIYCLIFFGWEYNYWICIILYCFFYKYDFLIGIFNYVNVGYFYVIIFYYIVVFFCKEKFKLNFSIFV